MNEKKKIGDRVMYFPDRGDHGLEATVTAVHSSYCVSLKTGDGAEFTSICFRDAPGQAATWGECAAKPVAKKGNDDKGGVSKR